MKTVRHPFGACNGDVVPWLSTKTNVWMMHNSQRATRIVTPTSAMIRFEISYFVCTIYVSKEHVPGGGISSKHGEVPKVSNPYLRHRDSFQFVQHRRTGKQNCGFHFHSFDLCPGWEFQRWWRSCRWWRWCRKFLSANGVADGCNCCSFHGFRVVKKKDSDTWSCRTFLWMSGAKC